MVISYNSNGEVNIKTKTETVQLGGAVTIGSFVVPGPGEYDIADIQCEAKGLSQSFACFLRTEELTIAFLSMVEPEVAKLNDASATNILVVDVKSDDQPEALKPIVKSIEPSYVVLTGAGATPAFAAGLGLPKVEESTLKLTRAGLPMEGTYLFNRD